MFAPSTRRSSDSLARGLPRLLSTLLVLGLLGGTAAAFAVTERLKLVPSPIIAPKVTEAFSPVCGGGCKTREARIRFGLRDADRLTVTIIDEDDEAVATIADAEPLPAGPVEFVWDGRGAPEGVYRARVHLDDARRTIDIPNEMRLDTTPPTLTVERIRPTVFSPDGDGRADKVSAEYSGVGAGERLAPPRRRHPGRQSAAHGREDRVVRARAAPRGVRRLARRARTSPATRPTGSSARPRSGSGSSSCLRDGSSSLPACASASAFRPTRGGTAGGSASAPAARGRERSS